MFDAGVVDLLYSLNFDVSMKFFDGHACVYVAM